MPTIKINNVETQFPYKPYSVQEDYMKKVLDCLQTGRNGVLESPTGTGKSLCILCASLSWLMAKKAEIQAGRCTGNFEKGTAGGQLLKDLKSVLNEAAGSSDSRSNAYWNYPKIIYASRTHSQLAQVMKELKKTQYRHVKTAILGSRDQLCVHPQVSQEHNSNDKIQMCLHKIKCRTCTYYNNVDSKKEDAMFKDRIMDIEDFVQSGKKEMYCPYYMSRELKQSADIIFMPYNYLLDAKTRRIHGVDLSKNIVIFDEAHNIEQVCEEATSFQICSTEIAMCISELTAAMEELAKDIEQDSFKDQSSTNMQDFTTDDLFTSKTMFLNLENAIDAIKVSNPLDGDTLPGGYLFEVLEKAGFTFGKAIFIVEKLDKVVQYLATKSVSTHARKGNGLLKFNDLLRTVFTCGNDAQAKERIKECYKVHIELEDQRRSRRRDLWEAKSAVPKNEGKVINYWCFSPGFSMQQIMEQHVHSVILTSGTLSPLKAFVSELGIPIDVQLENPHIVKDNQFFIGILGQGPDNFQLNGSYSTRNDPRYIASLGQTVCKFSSFVPNGMLIFFPSYPLMYKCRDDWNRSGLWSQISRNKAIYVEPQSREEFPVLMTEYCKKIRDPEAKGAIFMAVCRGKVSEGLDFADANGRTVLITGIPYPPMKDPRVILKQKYLDGKKCKNRESLSGHQWYTLEAARAINQAIGRIIRHKDDYGAIILCDCRFENVTIRSHISVWLEPHIKKYSSFDRIKGELIAFFKNAIQTLPQPTIFTKSSASASLAQGGAGLASFDTITTCAGSIDNEKKMKHLTEIMADEILDAEIYMIAKDDTSTPSCVKKKSFSELLETESKPVINFASFTTKTNLQTCALTKQSDEPGYKRKKYKVLPLEYNEPLAGPLGCSSANTASSGDNLLQTQKDSHKVYTKIDKQMVGKTYLKSVKQTLSQSDYERFRNMVVNYTKTADYRILISVLETIFHTDNGLLHLFIGFKQFLKPEHIDAFESYIAKLKDKKTGLDNT